MVLAVIPDDDHAVIERGQLAVLVLACFLVQLKAYLGEVRLLQQRSQGFPGRRNVSIGAVDIASEGYDF